MSLTPEDILILSAVKVRPSEAELEHLNGLIPAVQDWELVAGTAIARGIAPLLYTKLPKLPNNGMVPDTVKAKLQQAYFMTVRRGALIYEYFREATGIFAKRAIPVIALKGIYLSEWLYGDIGLRQFSDIDLLVRPEDAPEVISILTGLGYKPENDDQGIETRLEVVHYSPMVLNGVCIEVHVKLHRDNERYDLNIASLWENALPAVINHTDILVLSPNDLLIHLCVHLERHVFEGHVQFTCFTDITNLLERYTDSFNWEEFIRICNLYSSTEIVFKWLLLASKYMNATLPAEIIEKYAGVLPAKTEELFIRFLHGHRGFRSGLPKHTGNLNHLVTVRDRLGYLWKILFPPKSFIIEKFQIKKPAFVAFYYLYRYFIGIKGLVKMMTMHD